MMWLRSTLQLENEVEPLAEGKNDTENDIEVFYYLLNHINYSGFRSTASHKSISFNIESDFEQKRMADLKEQFLIPPKLLL